MSSSFVVRVWKKVTAISMVVAMLTPQLIFADSSEIDQFRAQIKEDEKDLRQFIKDKKAKQEEISGLQGASVGNSEEYPDLNGPCDVCQPGKSAGCSKEVLAKLGISEEQQQDDEVCNHIYERRSDLSGVTPHSCADGVRNCGYVKKRLRIIRLKAELKSIETEIESKKDDISRDKADMNEFIGCPTCGGRGESRTNGWDLALGFTSVLAPAVMGGLGMYFGAKGMNNYYKSYGNYLGQCAAVGVPCQAPMAYGMGGMGGLYGGGLYGGGLLGGGLYGGINLGGGLYGGGMLGGGLYGGGLYGGGLYGNPYGGGLYGGGMLGGGLYGGINMGGGLYGNPYGGGLYGGINMGGGWGVPTYPYGTGWGGSMFPYGTVGIGGGIGIGGGLGGAYMGGVYGNPYMGGAYGGPYMGGAYGGPYMGGAYGGPYMGGAYGGPYMGGAYGSPYMGGAYGNPYMGGAYGSPYMGGAYGNPYGGLGNMYGNPYGGFGNMYGSPYGGFGNMYGNPQYGNLMQSSMMSQMLNSQRGMQSQQDLMYGQMQIYEAQQRYYQTLMGGYGGGYGGGFGAGFGGGYGAGGAF